MQKISISIYSKTTFILIFSFFLIKVVSAQSNENDLKLISQKPLSTTSDFAYYKRAGNDTKAIKFRNHSVISTINPLSVASKAMMYLYQNILSPQLSKSCPYEITCSNFSKQAISKFGIIKGTFLSADRLTRCNRISLLDVSLNDIDEQTGTIKDAIDRY